MSTLTTTGRPTDVRIMQAVEALNNDGDRSVYRSDTTLARPADTTAYTANDVVGAASAIIPLAGIGPSVDGGAGMILTRLALWSAATAIPPGMTIIRAHLFTVSPTAIADNAAWALNTDDVPNYLGFVDLSPAINGGRLWAQALPRLAFKLADDSSSLFAVLETRGAFTPVSGESYRLTAVASR
jgi:hypothetical protein